MGAVREFFKENGYYVARNLFQGKELERMAADFDRIVAQLQASDEEISGTWSGPEMERMGQTQSVVLHTHNVQQFSAVWHRAIMSEEFLGVAEAILGPDIVLHHTKLFYKPAEHGAPFPVHQDYTYFPTVKDSMIAGIIHVSDATDEMGCIRAYPGSHKLGRVADSSGQVESEFLKDYPLEKAAPFELEAGDVFFFHYFTLHGSMPNRSVKVRKTVLVQMYSGDDRVEVGNKHPDEGLALRGWNHHAGRGYAGRRKR